MPRPPFESRLSTASDQRATRTPRTLDELLTPLLNEVGYELSVRCRSHVERNRLFLSVGRLTSRALAHVAFHHVEGIGERTACHDRWLDACIDRAVVDLIGEASREELTGIPPEHSTDRDLYESFARRAEMDPSSARIAIAVLNGQTVEHRDAFTAIVQERRSPERHAMQTGETVGAIRGRIEETFGAIRRALRRKTERRSIEPHEG